VKKGTYGAGFKKRLTRGWIMPPGRWAAEELRVGYSGRMIKAAKVMRPRKIVEIIIPTLKKLLRLEMVMV
jgi:hypothetical protein